jgi:hypothetical protein
MNGLLPRLSAESWSSLQLAQVPSFLALPAFMVTPLTGLAIADMHRALQLTGAYR